MDGRMDERTGLKYNFFGTADSHVYYPVIFYKIIQTPTLTMTSSSSRMYLSSSRIAEGPSDDDPL